MKPTPTKETAMHTSPVSAPISRATRIAIALTAGAVALLAGACSTSAEITATVNESPPLIGTSAGDAASAPVAQTEQAGPDASVDCLELHEARVGIRGVGGNLIYAEDAEFVEVLIGGPEAVDTLLADVETLRPYQDIEVSPFGSIHEGLDNFVNDLAAATEGRFADIVGGYSPVAMNGLLAELGC